jgi:hypothetical protein
MRRTGNLTGDNMDGWELESSDADSMELEGAQVESSEGGKIAEQVKSSDAEASRAHSLRA